MGRSKATAVPLRGTGSPGARDKADTPTSVQDGPGGANGNTDAVVAVGCSANMTTGLRWTMSMVTTVMPGSFSFRTWGCTAGANELKGFVPHGGLLARHASHEPKPFPKVDPYDSTASAPHRGLRRDSRLSPLSG